MAHDPQDHPRRSLESDADALERVAVFADYLAAYARNGNPDAHPPVVPDPVNADRVDGEAALLRRWGNLCREAKDATPIHREP